MKKIIITLFSIICILSLFGCQKKKVDKSIEVIELRGIAELATVECYFHNVAASDKDLDPTWYEKVFGAKDKMRFWVEYDGVVSIGLDTTKIEVNFVDEENNIVQISLPEAEVLSVKVNEATLNEDSFYYDPDAKRPNAEEQKEAFKEAQESMRIAASSNSTLLLNAKENAKELLENYVNTIGKITGKEYTIQWLDYRNDTVEENQ